MKRYKVLTLILVAVLLMFACSTVTNTVPTPAKDAGSDTGKDDAGGDQPPPPDTPVPPADDTSGDDGGDTGGSLVNAACTSPSVDAGGYLYELPLINDTGNLSLLVSWMGFDGQVSDLATLAPGEGYTVTDAAIGDVYCFTDANTGQLVSEVMITNDIGTVYVGGPNNWYADARTDTGNITCNNASVNLGGEPYALELMNDSIDLEMAVSWVNYNGDFQQLTTLSPGQSYTVTDAAIGDFYCFTEATTGKVVSEVQINGGIGLARVVDFNNWYFRVRDFTYCDAFSAELGNPTGELYFQNDSEDITMIFYWAGYDQQYYELSTLAPGESYTVTDASVGDVYCFVNTATEEFVTQVYVSHPMAEIYVTGPNSWIYYTK